MKVRAIARYLCLFLALTACAVPVQPAQTVQPVQPSPAAVIEMPTKQAVTETVPANVVPALPQASQAGTPSRARRLVWIDTDMAGDDWMAILYLLNRPEIQVVAITVSGTGEAHCQPGMKHALQLVALANAGKIPVACGPETPLQGTHVFPQGFRDFVDNLAGIYLPEPADSPAKEDAVTMISALLAASTEKVTLLTLGPLTTPGKLFSTHPELSEKIQAIYTMGGAVKVAGNISPQGSGVYNQVAEWNIYVDPHAANLTFQSGIPVTLIALDATRFLPFTKKTYQGLQAQHSTPEASFVWEYFRANQWMFTSSTMFFWDQFAAVVLSDESLTRFETYPICVVEQEGPTSGQTKVQDGCPAIRTAVFADPASFESLLFKTLNAPESRE